MSRQANPAMVGGFVLGAALLAIASIIFFSSGALFRPTTSFVAYFPSSLAGLEVGAPVSFRGVRIGSVQQIHAIYDLGTDQIYLPVVFEIEGDRFEPVGDPTDATVHIDDDREAVAHLFRRGLRARLETRSILTGQLSIGLDMFPESEMRITGRTDLDLLEFPTLPTDIEQFLGRFAEIMETIKSAPLDEIFANLNSSLGGIDALVNSDDAKNALAGIDELANSEDLRQAIASLRQSMQNFDRAMVSVGNAASSAKTNVASLTDVLTDTAQKLQGTLEKAERALVAFESSMSADSDLRARTTRAMEELGRAAGAVRSLAEYLERHPEALIKGKSREGGMP